MSATEQDLTPKLQTLVAQQETKETQEAQLQTTLARYREHSQQTKDIVSVLKQLIEFKENGMDPVNEYMVLKELTKQLLPDNRALQEKLEALLPEKSPTTGLLGELLKAAASLTSISDPLLQHVTTFNAFTEQHNLLQMDSNNMAVPMSLLPQLTAQVSELDQGVDARTKNLAELNAFLTSSLELQSNIGSSLEPIFQAVVVANNQLKVLSNPPLQENREQKADDAFSQLQAQMDSLQNSITQAQTYKQSVCRLKARYADLTKNVNVTLEQTTNDLTSLNALNKVFERIENKLLHYKSVFDNPENSSRVTIALKNRAVGNVLAKLLLPDLAQQMPGFDTCLSKLNRFKTLLDVYKDILARQLKTVPKTGTANPANNLSNQLSAVQATLSSVSVGSGSETKTERPPGPALTPAANNTGTTTTTALASEEQSNLTKQNNKKKKKKR